MDQIWSIRVPRKWCRILWHTLQAVCQRSTNFSLFIPLSELFSNVASLLSSGATPSRNALMDFSVREMLGILRQAQCESRERK